MIALTVLGNPPRKNRRHEIVTSGKYPRRISTADYKDFVVRLHLAWTAAGSPRCTSGRLVIEIDAFWGRQRHLDDGTVVPFGDWDAPLETVSDALEEVGVIDDDVRFMAAVISKAYDKATPRVEIRIGGSG